MPYLLFFALLPRLITAGSVSKEQLNPVRRNSYPITPAVDESLLAIQIGGIVGAYVIFVAVLLSLLLFVGRRLRRAVLSSNYSLHVEMMKPVKPPPSMDPSPVTPISVNLPSPGPRSFSRSWSSLGKGSRSHASGTTTSVATIDESVVATDRQRAQEDLEMLYAAVMEHDAQKEAAAAARGANQDSSDGDEAVAEAAAEKEIPSPDSMPTNPFTDRSSHVSSNNSPLSPRSSGRLSRISSLSLFNLKSQNQQQSSSSNSSKLRSPRPFPLRKLSISSPVASPSYQADQTPLTPRHYNPPPRPPAPPLPVATPAMTAQKQQQPSLPQINTQPPPLPTPRLEPPRAKERSPRGPVPPPLTLTTPTGSNTTHHGRSPSSSLPFRDAYPLQSAPATKLTVLERPMKQLNGPRTGMPTPYSPYMPFTPVTPLTPSSMITKRQRRRAEKESGLKVLNEDDLVRDDGDMWGY